MRKPKRPPSCASPWPFQGVSMNGGSPGSSRNPTEGQRPGMLVPEPSVPPPFLWQVFRKAPPSFCLLLLPSPFGPPARGWVRWVTASETQPLGGQEKTRCRRIFHGRPESQEAKPAAVGRSRAAAKRRRGPGGAGRAGVKLKPSLNPCLRFSAPFGVANQ
jgi:hypothetical protein